MNIAEIFLIGVSLSMDAFAVAVCKGLKMKRVNYLHTLTISFSFGFFQGFMPLIGWFLGNQFEKYIISFDHWIAFVLLGFIGISMICEALKKDTEDEPAEERFSFRELFALSVATSIDALAVGITFAFLKVSIAPASFIIFITTLILSFVGALIGNRFGMKYKTKAELAGGITLCLLGTKILLEHLGIINF